MGGKRGSRDRHGHRGITTYNRRIFRHHPNRGTEKLVQKADTENKWTTVGRKETQKIKEE